MLGHHQESGTTKVRNIIKSIINNERLRNEIEEVATFSSKRSKKSPNSESPDPCYELVKFYDLFEQKPTVRVNGGGDHATNPQCSAETIGDILNGIQDETPADTILNLFSASKITATDLFIIDPDKLLSFIPKIIHKSESTEVGSRLFSYMIDYRPQFLIQLLQNMLSESNVEIEPTKYCTLSTSILIEVTTGFIQAQHSLNIHEIYSSILTLQNQTLFQYHRTKLEIWYGSCDNPPRLLDRIKNTFCVGKLNPMHVISVVGSLVQLYPQEAIKLTTEVITHSIATCNSRLFVLQLILLRLFDQMGKKTYTESYKEIFGPGSTCLTSSKNVEFVLGEFVKLVPYEIGEYLKYHISQQLKGGGKIKEKLEEYLIVAKTRMKDFNAQELDRNVVSEVIKSIESFNRSKKLPMSIREASIFKKQYFTSYFLPCLLYSDKLAGLQGRQELVECLKQSLKLPKNLQKPPATVTNMELEEITPKEKLCDDIDRLASLPRKTAEFSSLANLIYSQLCILQSKEVLKRLIIRCFSERTLSDKDAVYLKRFYENKTFQKDMADIVHELLSQSPSSPYFAILSTFHDSDILVILQRCIIEFKPSYATEFIDMMNSNLQKRFPHLILLGGTTSATRVLNWGNINVSALCEALSWFPYTVYSDFLHKVTEIFDTIFQCCDDVTELLKELFKCCISYDILPLVSPSLLTAYSMVPDTGELAVYEQLADILLPLYRTPDKPVATIKHIFRNFFVVIMLLDPTLLFKSGTMVSLDNIVSVLDSYKRYITSSNFTIKLAVLVVIVKAFNGSPHLFKTLCHNSSLLVVSCVFHYKKLRQHAAIKATPAITNAVNFLEQSDKKMEVNAEDLGVSLCLLSEASTPKFEQLDSVGRLGFIISQFHLCSILWIKDELKDSHLSDIGCKILRKENLKSVKVAVSGDYSNYPRIKYIFEGYRTHKVTHLICLGGIAAGIARGHDTKCLTNDSYQLLIRECYRMGQRIIYDKPEVMQALQGFARSLSHTVKTREQPRNARDPSPVHTRDQALSGNGSVIREHATAFVRLLTVSA